MLLLMLVAAAPAALAATNFSLDWQGYGTMSSDWSGNGGVSGGFNAIGTTASFSTSGSTIVGSWDVVLTPDVGHGVDHTTSDFQASFSNGVIQYNEQRSGDTSVYPDFTHESSYSQLLSDGTGSIDQYVITNYVSLYTLYGENLFAASGDYIAQHGIYDGNNGAQWTAGVQTQSGVTPNTGTMTISERIDAADYSGSTVWNLGGPACGCYGTSAATFTGSGGFSLQAQSDNYLAGIIGTPYASAHPGWTMPAGGSYGASWNFDGGLVFPDFSLAGN